MMELVGHPVAVNPDGPLRDVAHERAWPIVIFARRTKRAIALATATGGAAAFGTVSYLLGRRHGRIAALADTVSAISERAELMRLRRSGGG